MSSATALVYLTLASQAGRPRLTPDPLVASLHLPPGDDPRLLIALGEISGSNRPLVPKRLTRLKELLILWLGEREWLVLPHPRFGTDLERALVQAFGPPLSLEPLPDGCVHAELPRRCALRLADAESRPLNGSGRVYVDAADLQALCIHPWTSRVQYHLLLTREDLALLGDWLGAFQPADH